MKGSREMAPRQARRRGDSLDRFLRSAEQSHSWLFAAALPEEVAHSVKLLEERKPGLKLRRSTRGELTQLKTRLVERELEFENDPTLVAREMTRRAAEKAAVKTAADLQNARRRRAHRTSVASRGLGIDELIRSLGRRTSYALAAGPYLRAQEAARPQRQGRLLEAQQIIRTRLEAYAEASVRVRRFQVGLFKDPAEVLACARDIVRDIKRLDERHETIAVKVNLGLSAISASQTEYRGLGFAALMQSIIRASHQTVVLPRAFTFRADAARSIFRGSPIGPIEETKGDRVTIALA